MKRLIAGLADSFFHRPAWNTTSGQIKGEATKFTDTTEHLARSVAEAGDSLWSTKEPGRLEKVKTDQKP